MASYAVLNSRRTTWVRSATAVEDVQEFSVITNPSGVTFTRVVPYASFKNHSVASLLAPIANHIETLMANEPIVSGVGVQLVNDAGLITNAVEFTVQYVPADPSQGGPYTTTVQVTVQSLHDEVPGDQLFQSAIQALAASLP